MFSSRVKRERRENGETTDSSRKNHYKNLIVSDKKKNWIKNTICSVATPLQCTEHDTATRGDADATLKNSSPRARVLARQRPKDYCGRSKTRRGWRTRGSYVRARASDHRTVVKHGGRRKFLSKRFGTVLFENNQWCFEKFFCIKRFRTALIKRVTTTCFLQTESVCLIMREPSAQLRSFHKNI